MTLRRLLVITPTFALLLVACAWFWLLHTQSGAQWLLGRVESATDGALQAPNVTGDLGSGLTVRFIVFDGGEVNVAIDAINLQIDVDLLPLSVNVESVRVSGMRVRTGDNGDPGSADVDELLQALQLPVLLNVSSFEVIDASIGGPNEAEDVVVASASLAGRWKDEIEIDQFHLSMPGIDIEGDGRLVLGGDNELDAVLGIVLEPAVTGLDVPFTMDAAATGTLDILEVRLTSDRPVATLVGTVYGISNDVRWDIVVEAPGLSLTSFTGVPPELPPMQVRFVGDGNLESMTVDARVVFQGTNMQLDLDGDIDFAASRIASTFRWENGHWPIGVQQPTIHSESGQVLVSGSIDDWSVSGSVDLDIPQLPPGEFGIDGRGDRNQASVNITEGNLLGGTVTGRAEFSWRGDQEYEAVLAVANIDTSVLLPEWPATLNGGIRASGQRQPSRMSLILDRVDGELLGQQLTANGRVEVVGNVVSVDDLSLQHGETRVHLDGGAFDRNGMQFDITVDELGHYIDESAGSLSASGIVSLNADSPELRLDASSQALSYGDFQLGDLSITDLNSGDSLINAEVTIGASNLAGFAVESAQLLIEIDRDSQSLELAFSESGWRVGIAVAGAFDDWQQPMSWAGKIGQLDVAHESFRADLRDEVEVFGSRQSAAVERLCLASDRGIDLCTDVSWSGEEGFDVSASASSFPVEVVNAFVDTGLVFDQLVSGALAWRQDANGQSTGRVDISLTPGTITGVDRDDLQIKTAQGEIRFEVEDNDLHSGIVDLPFPDLGQVSAEFQILDVASTDPGNVSGRVDVSLSDIGPVATLLPVFDKAGGRLRANLDVSGKSMQPTYSGEVALEDGSLSYLPIGLELNDLQVDSIFQSDGKIEVSGSFLAGEGRAHVLTRTDFDQAVVTGINVEFSGENLTIMNVPDVRAVADVDVNVSYDGETLALNGRIDIPQAVITPANIGATRAFESEDVVIIAGELPEEDAAADAEDFDMFFSGNLVVGLGTDVKIDLNLAQANLTGSVGFGWNGDIMPIANGRYDLQGNILAFGQKLEIVEGGLRFPGVPANDPQIRIRAEREIYGNTEVKRAGVLVDGTTDRTTVEAYTNPLTTEERALTLLVTGSDFDYEKGIGAVDFGTYIAPKLYASYGIGLFDKENVIRIRYDLARGFGVTATSGQKESGLDFNYRFEN